MLSGTVFSVKLLAFICPICIAVYCLHSFIRSTRVKVRRIKGSCFYIPLLETQKEILQVSVGKTLARVLPFSARDAP